MLPWVAWTLWLACRGPAAPIDGPAPPAPVEVPPAAERTDAGRPSDQPFDRPRGRPAGPVVCGLDPIQEGPGTEALTAQGARLGLDHPDAFASVVTTLARTERLPGCYRTKGEADDAGWSRGRPVWDALPGGALGGDRFGNRERRLPSIPRSETYREADLDDDGGRRGAHRLVWHEGHAGEGHVWVTVDHYGSFERVVWP